MHFDLVDRVLESGPQRIVTIKNVSAAEEYLGDHFPTFPVLPGVLMLESLVQAARRWLVEHAPGDLPAPASRYVIASVRAMKYGTFVRPGETLRVEVIPGGEKDGIFTFKGSATVERIGESGESPVAVSGKFALRAPRIAGPH